jgi:hypothetical protein
MHLKLKPMNFTTSIKILRARHEAFCASSFGDESKVCILACAAASEVQPMIASLVELDLRLSGLKTCLLQRSVQRRLR